LTKIKTIACIFINFYFKDEIPDLETVYEDISITNEFKIDNAFLDFSEAVNESKLSIVLFNKMLTIFFINF